MRVCYLILLSCLAAGVCIGFDITATMRPEVVKELTRAIELEHQGQIKEAEQVLLKVIRTAEAADNDNIELGVAVNNLAVLYVATDRYADAERQFMRSMRILQALPDGLSEQVLARAKLHLAALYLEMGRGPDAAKLNVAPLVDVLRVPEDQARVKSILAGLAASRKDFDEAERIYTQALAFWREPSRAGTAQVEVATIMNNLGVIALSQGRIDTARRRLEESFAAWQGIVGPENPHLVKAMGNVAAVCMQAKQYGDATMWLAKATVIGEKVFGESHPYMVALQFAYADALKKAGRKSEASQIARMASAARKMMRNPSTSQHTIDYREIMSVRAKTNER